MLLKGCASGGLGRDGESSSRLGEETTGVGLRIGFGGCIACLEVGVGVEVRSVGGGGR